MDDVERQDALYADELWAKLAVKAGFRPYNTESSARAAFSFCADHITVLEAENARLREGLRTIAAHEQRAARDPYEAAARQPLIDIARTALEQTGASNE